MLLLVLHTYSTVLFQSGLMVIKKVQPLKWHYFRGTIMISHIIFVFSVHFSKQTSVIYVPDLLIYTNNFLIFNGFFFYMYPTRYIRCSKPRSYSFGRGTLCILAQNGTQGSLKASVWSHELRLSHEKVNSAFRDSCCTEPFPAEIV